MGERDDDGLGLSLSLTFSQRKEPSLKPNLPPLMTSSSPPHIIHKIHHNNWSHLFKSSERNVDVGRFFSRGIDVNKAPPSVTVVDVEEDGEGGVSSPNSTVSSVSGNKRSERDLKTVGGGENDGERASCSHGGGSDDEDGGNGGDGSRKKLRLSKEQALVLEETFKEHSTLNPKQKVGLAKRLNLTARQVEVWFQNRRARTKLKQTEVDCEYLKRCCDNLTEENRRLQKEVTELRTLKLSPHLYMHVTPPTTLTMCPSCERVAVSSAANLNPTVRRPSPQRPGPGSPWTAISLQPRSAH